MVRIPRSSIICWDGSNSPRSSIICWKCGREGHIARFFSSTAGKLDTLDTNGEGNITNKASVTNHVTFSSVTGLSTYRVQGTVNDCPVTFIVDTGAAFTLLRADSWRKINPLLSHAHSETVNLN